MLDGQWTVFTTDGIDTTMSNDVWNILIDAGGASGSVTVDHSEGWNLVGLPLEVESSAYGDLFPSSVGNTLYGFSGTYTPESELTPGAGYWLNFSSDGSEILTGSPIQEITLSLSEGWNLISGIFSPVDLGSIDDPDGVIVSNTLYGFSGLYESSTVIEPGKGYWLNASQDGEVSLIVGEDPPEGVSYSTEIQPIFNDNCISCHNNGGGYFGGLDLSTYENLMLGNSNNGPVVTAGDGTNSYIIQKLQGTATGAQMPDGASPLPSDQINLIAQWIDEGAMNNRENSSKVRINQIQSANTLNIKGFELFFGLDLSAREKLSYSLPPKPPVGASDVRFKGDTRVTKEKAEIEIMSTTENITIAYNIVIDAGEHMNWILSSDSGIDYILEGSGEIIVSSVERFVLSREPVIPITFALHQNFPNPFNPITTLRYDLPSDALVTLSIYDMLGREITQLVNATQEAGFKSVQWDATDSMGRPVSAGVYLYQIQAEKFVQTKKMVLLK
jgi:mono/diheme cytochrome c family protein